MKECEWLHNQLSNLPLFGHPIDLSKMPKNGIYFFYENGENCNHTAEKKRIVRIGTHKDGNFSSRISEHYWSCDKKLDFSSGQSKISDRSIFRKNIGRAILNKAGDSYLNVWNEDFTTKKNREEKNYMRDLLKEVAIEGKITEYIRNNMKFRFILFPGEKERMGSGGMESRLIGTVAKCRDCNASKEWLGNWSPVSKIRESGLWLYQHLDSIIINDGDKTIIDKMIEDTKVFVAGN